MSRRPYPKNRKSPRGVWRDMLGEFWARVEVNGADECWPWIGETYPIPSGYGRFHNGRLPSKVAHRTAWEIVNRRPVPDGLIVLHSCDNKPCCNPAHLRVGTHADNTRDKMARGRHAGVRQTHCKRGHPLSGDNLSIRCDGARVCLTCKRSRDRLRYAAVGR